MRQGGEDETHLDVLGDVGQWPPCETDQFARELGGVAEDGHSIRVDLDEEDRIVGRVDELPHDPPGQAGLLGELAQGRLSGSLTRLDAAAGQGPDQLSVGTRLVDHQDRVVAYHCSRRSHPVHEYLIGSAPAGSSRGSALVSSPDRGALGDSEARRTLKRMDVGPPELLIVFLVVVLLFGGAKIPELARSLGKAKREFEKGSSGAADETDTSTT